ncbi:MAG: hypothetical protein GX595_07635 [Lentisphaerae bacterium]|nr:hypothetical protein [Lentisphaerota bacterium]
MTPPGVIIIDPVLPPWLILALVLAVGWGAWRTYRDCALTGRQRWLLWALRLSAVLILSWLMLLPRQRSTVVTREPPVLVLALDVSASMTDNPGKHRETRRDRALAFLDQGRTAALSERYRVVRYSLGAELEEGLPALDEVVFNAPRSHLGTCLNRMVERLRAENLAGIVLLTDGLDHSGERPTPHSLRVPVFIPELEEPFAPEAGAGADFWIAEVSHPRLMAVHWKAGVEVLIRRRGTAAAAFPVQLQQGGQEVRSSLVQFAEGETFRQVTFTVEPVAVGQALYRVEIAPDVAIDSVTENNRREFMVEVTDPKNKVLYVEGVPRWEFKFLKRALLSEPNYQLSAYVRSGDGQFINFDEGSGQAAGDIPRFTPEGLLGYRVIVLGDMEASALSDDDRRHIRDFVDKGGGLLLVGAARSYGPGGLMQAAYLQDLMPALSAPGASMKEGRFSVDLTPAGRTHPGLADLALESGLPPLLSFWSPVTVGEFSSVLVAAGDASPVVAVRRFGQGRVAMLLSDSLWRWQLGESEAGADKSLYNRFVTQVVYWLAPSEKEVERSSLLQVVTARPEVELREKVTVGAIFDAGEEAARGLTCRVQTPSGKVQVYPMLAAALGKDVGLARTVDGFRSFFTAQEPGQYTLTVATADGTQSAGLVLLAAEPEHERTGAPLNRDYLAGLAKDTGGRFVSWSERSELLKDLPHTTQEFTQVIEHSIWDRWWWIGVLIALFCAEWWWRRKLDLV